LNTERECRNEVAFAISAFSHNVYKLIILIFATRESSFAFFLQLPVKKSHPANSVVEQLNPVAFLVSFMSVISRAVCFVVFLGFFFFCFFFVNFVVVFISLRVVYFKFL